MSLFTSSRERRLWVWVLAVVVAIYSTLGLARPLAGFLRDTGILEISYVICMLLVGATVLTQGLKTRPGGAELGVALGIGAVYLLVIIRMSIPEERTHLIEYGVVAIFVHEALKERARQREGIPAALLAVLISSAVGVVDELIQALLPNRVFDLRDILFNGLASAMAEGV